MVTTRQVERHSSSSRATSTSSLLQCATPPNSMVDWATIVVHLFAFLCISVYAEVELPDKRAQFDDPCKYLFPFFYIHLKFFCHHVLHEKYFFCVV
ncbi:unnamed protein product [Toxocara canis]|uniref:Transmembrane protein n=1 Tax=Toxocara canis TaxID=6265 RepID=A0A183VCJ6_TOXCA|nr:unnamed protein product [Toxocara canis]